MARLRTHPRLIRFLLLASSISAIGILHSGPAQPHALAPALLDIRALDDGLAEVTWKTSPLKPRGAEVVPIFPESCPTVSEPVFEETLRGILLIWRIDCGKAGLVGQRISVSGLQATRIDVIVHVALPGGRQVNQVLRSSDDSFVIPARTEKFQVFRSYSRMGTEHILSGPDHLLFVLGLLLLVVQIRPLIKTVTAFTLGHSLTLSLVALDLIHVPSSLVEVAIAASVLLLAVELATPKQNQPSLLRRRPWLMAVAFGLLHGMGFAGALAEVGLPQEEIPMALFSFNLGIEVGQVAFILAMGALWWGVRRFVAQVPPALQRVPAYCIGTLAAYWCLDRAAALF